LNIRPNAIEASTMHEPTEDADLFAFPELPDEAVIALNDFIAALYTRFQNRYFPQMHRYYHDRPEPHRYSDQLPLPLDELPF
jgi:hypothetical protein